MTNLLLWWEIDWDEKCRVRWTERLVGQHSEDVCGQPSKKAPKSPGLCYDFEHLEQVASKYFKQSKLKFLPTYIINKMSPCKKHMAPKGIERPENKISKSLSKNCPDSHRHIYYYLSFSLPAAEYGLAQRSQFWQPTFPCWLMPTWERVECSAQAGTATYLSVAVWLTARHCPD